MTRNGCLAVLSDEQSVLTVVQDGEHLVFCCQAGGGKLLKVWLEPSLCENPKPGVVNDARVRPLMPQGLDNALLHIGGRFGHRADKQVLRGGGCCPSRRRFAPHRACGW